MTRPLCAQNAHVCHKTTASQYHFHCKMVGSGCLQGHAPPAQLASAQMFAARLGTGPTRVVLLKNMLKALQLLDETERTEASAILFCTTADTSLLNDLTSIILLWQLACITIQSLPQGGPNQGNRARCVASR